MRHFEAVLVRLCLSLLLLFARGGLHPSRLSEGMLTDASNRCHRHFGREDHALGRVEKLRDEAGLSFLAQSLGGESWIAPGLVEATLIRRGGHQ